MQRRHCGDRAPFGHAKRGSGISKPGNLPKLLKTDFVYCSSEFADGIKERAPESVAHSSGVQ